MKYKIEKNTVQETLIIPLYARKVCSQLYPNLYRDETAVSLINEIDYDFSEAEKNSRRLMQRFGSLEVAMRQNDLAFEVKDYLKIHPNAAVVNLGCGLDNTGRSCDNGSCKIYNLDFSDVIAVRNKLLPAGDREENIPCDLNNTEWFSKIDAADGAYFAVSDAKSELSPWDSRLQVTSRGYMLGYNDLRDPSVSGFFRFLAKVGDGMMKMQIVRLDFKGA